MILNKIKLKSIIYLNTVILQAMEKESTSFGDLINEFKKIEISNQKNQESIKKSINFETKNKTKKEIENTYFVKLVKNNEIEKIVEIFQNKRKNIYEKKEIIKKMEDKIEEYNEIKKKLIAHRRNEIKEFNELMENLKTAEKEFKNKD